MSGHSKLVLIADDYEEIASTLGLVISMELGYEVLVASNGRQAVDIAVARQPDIAVLEIDLPLIDGIEAAWESRASLGPERPLLIAHSGGSGILRATMSGAFDHVLTKPTDFGWLRKLIS